ncbi:substrate-binding periplasmic protein [Litoribrevibacter albus]|uniref:substrate-binding periplasmic protein n=1 Tax=Litoribrevibacter albus TaxID=1473156 RepID=UPI0024E0C79A|nr:transporter substrate-binding domain-containing protein [Litoribrevibacter albus]
MRSSFFACLILLFSYPLSAQAESTLLISTSNVMPWGIEKSDAPNEGLLVEFAKAFGDSSGIRYKNRLKPYPRVINDIRLGHADLAVLFESPESERIAYSLGEVTSVDVIAVSKSSHRQIWSLSDLDGERVAYVRGSKYGHQFDQHKGFKKVPVNNMNQGLKMLMQNHVDVVVSTDQSIYYGIDSLGIQSKWLKKLLVISTATANLYLSKQSAFVHKKDELSAVVKKMKAGGILNHIFYGRDYISSQELNRQETWHVPSLSSEYELITAIQ